MASMRSGVRTGAALLALSLGGCVSNGPTITPQQVVAVHAVSDRNEADARAHRITWAEAARRDAAEARKIGGDRVTPDDELNFSLRIALGAEVDAGRMTPEMAALRYQEQLARQRQASQARADEAQRRLGEAMMIAGQSMQNAAAAARPVSCTSIASGVMLNTTCY